MSDEEMETKRLDLSLTSGLVTLTIIAIALPLYWLGEPGRHSGLVEFTDDQFVRQGEEIYAENCAQCHGSANGDGGLAADFSLVDSSGVYVEQVQWQAPSLGAVLDRFSYDEFKYILNFGRQNSPMPAWGGPGGGPMTDQQIDKVIAYIAHEQKSSEEIAKGVLDGLSGAALAKARGDNYDLYTRQLQLEAELSEVQHDIDDAPEGADTSALEAAKDAILAEHGPIVDELAETAAAILVMSDTAQVVLGPSLVGVLDQFETAASMESFIVTGTKNGVAYGAFGQGDGGGQMPGFGACWAEDNPLDFPRIQGDRISGHCEGRSGTLTTDQIAAIVAYERSLGGEG
jgi:mono/diheme cytochrome c family protein